MCRNKQKQEARSQESGVRLFLCIVCLLFSVLWELSFAHAEPLKVSLLLGDANSKTALEAVKAIYNEYPDLKEKTAFHVYPLKGIREKGLRFLGFQTMTFFL